MTTLFGDNIQALHEETDGFSRLTKHLEPSAIQEVLERHGSFTVRRRKLPQEMVIWLVIRITLGASWGKQVEGHTWRGLRTFGVDGTVLNVFDSEDNDTYFGKPGSNRDKDSAAYPQVRFVGLMELSSKM